MNPQATAQAVFVALSAAFAVVVFVRWIPWVGRLLALYGLHGLRDQLYEAAREYPTARKTRLYRDVEAYFCCLIKTVREEPVEVAVSIYLDLLDSRPTERQKSLSRIYSQERDQDFAGEKGQRAHDAIVSSCYYTRRFMMIYVFMGHPIFQVIGVIAAVIYGFTAPTRWLSQARVWTDVSARATATTLHRDSTSRPLFAAGKDLGERLIRGAA
jgi:hypothetical protein